MLLARRGKSVIGAGGNRASVSVVAIDLQAPLQTDCASHHEFNFDFRNQSIAFQKCERHDCFKFDENLQYTILFTT